MKLVVGNIFLGSVMARTSSSNIDMDIERMGPVGQTENTLGSRLCTDSNKQKPLSLLSPNSQGFKPESHCRTVSLTPKGLALHGACVQAKHISMSWKVIVVTWPLKVKPFNFYYGIKEGSILRLFFPALFSS